MAGGNAYEGLLIDTFPAIRIRLNPLRQSEWSLSMTNQPHAIIIGGGIGGLASGIALGGIGCTVNIYEQAPELHKVGAGLSLWANAIRALEKLGSQRRCAPYSCRYRLGASIPGAASH
jgi:hypothetical protein